MSNSYAPFKSVSDDVLINVCDASWKTVWDISCGDAWNSVGEVVRDRVKIASWNEVRHVVWRGIVQSIYEQ